MRHAGPALRRRFELGLGAGRPGVEADHRQLGIPFDPGGVRVARLAEALGLVKSLLAGEPATAPGPHYAAAGAEIYPRPVQRPRPPVLVAAAGPRLPALAAREADIVAIGVGPNAGEAGLRERIDRVRSAAPERFPDLELNVNLAPSGSACTPSSPRGSASTRNSSPAPARRSCSSGLRIASLRTRC